jgi:hypothetical protein
MAIKLTIDTTFRTLTPDFKNLVFVLLPPHIQYYIETEAICCLPHFGQLLS